MQQSKRYCLASYWTGIGICLFVLSGQSCSTTEPQIIEKIIHDTIVITERKHLDFIDRNSTDENGLKQGTWIEYNKAGEIFNIQNYHNDTLNGLSVEYNHEDRRMWKESNYKKGKIHGYQRFFQSNTGKEPKYMTYFENDERIWVMFPSTDTYSLYTGKQPSSLIKGIHLSVEQKVKTTHFSKSGKVLDVHKEQSAKTAAWSFM